MADVVSTGISISVCLYFQLEQVLGKLEAFNASDTRTTELLQRLVRVNEVAIEYNRSADHVDPDYSPSVDPDQFTDGCESPSKPSSTSSPKKSPQKSPVVSKSENIVLRSSPRKAKMRLDMSCDNIGANEQDFSKQENFDGAENKSTEKPRNTGVDPRKQEYEVDTVMPRNS